MRHKVPLNKLVLNSLDVQLVTDRRLHSSDHLTRIHNNIQDTSGLAAYLGLSIWENSDGLDLKVFGRYTHVRRADHIFTQDDDCLVSVSDVVSAYEPGVVTCNMPQHRRAEYADGVALVGWGAIFDRNLTGVFNLYLRHFPIDDLFLTECDRVFTGLNKVKMIDVPFVNLENAEGADRLHKRPDHWDKLREIRERIGFVKRKEGMA